MDLTKGLNPMQAQGVLQMEGPVLILAGAGSGKTRVLTHRIAHLIQNGVEPFNILAVTFTNKAAKEMKERVCTLTPEGNEVWVATFHSTCVRILRSDITKLEYYRNFTIYDADDAERLIKICLKELNINEKQLTPKSAMYEISAQKNELIGSAQYARKALEGGDFRQKQLSKVYNLYQKKLLENNCLDFDDIIFKTVELFQTFPEVLRKYQSRFKYIMVDEYQDTNTAQYTLIKLLASLHQNLCVVGDDDQSIYGWRGANIRNILDFEKDFKNAVVIRLEQNYRSTSTILDAANSVIHNNLTRKDKKLWTTTPNGDLIKYKKLESDKEEAQYVVETIKQEVKKGQNYNDIAILYRINMQSRLLEEQLIFQGVPYRIFGGLRFYERKEIKDILSYLRAVSNPFDDIAYRRIINVPKRGIGDTTVEKIVKHALENEMSFANALEDSENIEGIKKNKIQDFYSMMTHFVEFEKNHTVLETLNEILDQTEYTEELKADFTDESSSRVENIQSFLQKVEEFEKQTENPTLSSFLEEVSLVADIDNHSGDENVVALMTLHSSKGLEFPTVFITGFEECIFPSYRSIISSNRDEIEEERRLCYVGITRAKEKLFLLSAKERMHNGYRASNASSRFLSEIDSSCVEMDERRTSPKPTKKPQKAADKTVEPKTSTLTTSYFNKMPLNSSVKIDFQVGDSVRQMKYGVGIVKAIQPAGADYEITVEFKVGEKKFMANLSKLKKV